MDSILENCQRATVSSPPVYGAQIASAVLNNPAIAKQWAQDLVTMSSRILSMRQKLYYELNRLKTPGDWSHIVKQSGMFGYTGITPAQIKHMQSESQGRVQLLIRQHSDCYSTISHIHGGYLTNFNRRSERGEC